MKTGFVWHERYGWHDAGNAMGSEPFFDTWPAFDIPETKRRIFSLVSASGLLDQLVSIPARYATEDDLLRWHTPDYIARIRKMSEAEGGNAGEAARFGPGGYDVARLALGGCLAAADAVISGEAANAYALVRPCGHHASADFGRGFCIFANVALVAKYLQDVHGLGKVAVVDWDVHHGNGTQEAFYEDPSVLTISLHQSNNYPRKTGGAEETGSGAGLGFNLNIPLPPGSGHEAYLGAMHRAVSPALAAFKPEMILVASGLDACVVDPLGRMLCYSETYRAMALSIKAAADTVCGGRLLACHEGGYSALYAPYCALAIVEAMSGCESGVDDPLRQTYSELGGHALQPHQASVIDAAADRAATLGQAR